MARLLSPRDRRVLVASARREAADPGALEARAAGLRRPRPDRLLRGRHALVPPLAGRRPGGAARPRAGVVLRKPGPGLANGRDVAACRRRPPVVPRAARWNPLDRRTAGRRDGRLPRGPP